MKPQVALTVFFAGVAWGQHTSTLDTQKECPPGFEFVGKQCMHIAKAPLEWKCSEGNVIFGHHCAVFSSKLSECPPGYLPSRGHCSRTQTAPAIINCPAGFVLAGPRKCIKQIELPPTYACPPGTISRDDKCFEIVKTEAAYTCLPKFRLEGSTCIFEEIYDCTGKPGTQCVGQTLSGSATFQKAKAKLVNSGKHGPPVAEEFVVSAQCKKIVVEPARKVCPHSGRLEGKHCIVETQVPAIPIPGGHAEEEAPVVETCPPGFEEGTAPKILHHPLECIRTEIVPELHVCPPHTEDLGDRCAVLTERRPVCPDGFHRHDDHCVKVTYAEPVVEWTVKYTCTGKDCEVPKDK